MLAREPQVAHPVTLRPLRLEDLPALHRWRSHPEVVRLTGRDRPESAGCMEAAWLPAIMDPEGARTWHYAIETGRGPTGVVSLMDVDPNNSSCRLELLIGDPDLWGRGLGADALARALNMAFGACGLHRVTAEIPAHNARAYRLLRSAGFLKEGVRRDALRVDGRWADVLVLSLLEGDWRQRVRPELWAVGSLCPEHYPWARRLCPETGCEPEEAEHYLKDDEGFVWSFDGQPAGFLTWSWRPHEVEIRILAVDHAFRRRGLAMRMLQFVRDEAIKRGIPRVMLLTSNDNTPAMHLYQKAGFVMKALYPGRLERRRGHVMHGHDGIPVRDDVEMVWNL